MVVFFVQLHFTTRVRYGFLSVQLNYTIRLGFSFPFAKQISGVDLPRRGREYGRGRGTKGPKQIRLEILSLFLVKLPPSGEVDCIPVESSVISVMTQLFCTGRKGCS